MLEIDNKKVSKNIPITHRIAEDQDEYITLPANIESGVVSFAFKLKIKDLLKIIFRRRVWIYILTFNKPLQPIHVNVDRKGFEEAQAYAVKEYGSK